jgi:uncharacterized protein with von Willebrand factor type A (vWA) domain
MTLPAPDPARDPRVAGDSARHGRFRYARWDGTQRLPQYDADDVLEALADDLMAEGDVDEALRRLFRRGMRRRPDAAGDDGAGLRDLIARLADRRRELLERYQLDDVLRDVREELDAVVATERRGIERRLAEAEGDAPDADPTTESMRDLMRRVASRREQELEALPDDPGGRIRALQGYDFLEPSARDRFEALLGRLRQQMLDSYFQGLSESIRSMTPEALAANREMVRDLNRLLEERMDGREPDASEFLAKHGRFFPGARDLDDIIEQLAERMAAMQSLMASMSSEQRQELQGMMDALLRDDRLRWDLAQLAATLDQLLPDGLGQRMEFRGDESLSLEGALQQMARVQQLDRLADQLGNADDAGALADVDPDELRELLDERSAQDLAALQSLAKELEDAGYVERHGDRLELTARGSRRLGQRVLDDLFARLGRDAFGGHRIDHGGVGGEATDHTVPYEFGRPFHLDLRQTLANAAARPENARGHGESGPLRLRPDDFAVRETEELTSAATVLLVDMSRSMLLRGCFVAAKKVAVAMDTLIRTRFPRDELHVVGFAYYAREIKPGALASLSWHGYEYGTNLQHGLLLARRLLARSRATNRAIVVVTDGEPTAHFEGGHVEFSYPPTRRTISETLKEVARCTREGVTINTFMLERSRSLAEFVERMTRLNRGRAFYATPERLGEYVLVDYVGRKTARR